MRKTLVLAVATAAVALGGCNVMRGQQSAGEYADDAALTARVKAALLDNETVEGTDINVNVYEGKVQLSGFADSASERSAAERIARDVDGVKGVQNNIQLKGETSQSTESTSQSGSATSGTTEQPSTTTGATSDEPATSPDSSATSGTGSTDSATGSTASEQDTTTTSPGSTTSTQGR